PDDIRPFLDDAVVDGPDRLRHASLAHRTKPSRESAIPDYTEVPVRPGYDTDEHAAEDFLWQHIDWAA
ncbi:hypothetical protein EVJ58_g8718, partial [Rhodofomes roseus]